jgi:hypothetical protein
MAVLDYTHMKYAPLLIGILFLAPFAASAQDPSGLVTCSGPDCNFCSLVSMVNVLTDWLFGFLVLAAVLVLMIAGFKLVVSSGNPGAMSDAKSMATNVIIGFVLVMAGWLIVDTIIKALVVPGSEFASWDEIQGAQCGGVNVFGGGGGGSDDSVLYCYASDSGTTNVYGLDACNEARSQAEDEGQNPGACYVCGG